MLLAHAIIFGFSFWMSCITLIKCLFLAEGYSRRRKKSSYYLTNVWQLVLAWAGIFFNVSNLFHFVVCERNLWPALYHQRACPDSVDLGWVTL